MRQAEEQDVSVVVLRCRYCNQESRVETFIDPDGKQTMSFSALCGREAIGSTRPYQGPCLAEKDDAWIIVSATEEESS